ncbi:MAG: UDP-N-acetylmuramate dehydrogenase [Bacilli bacterium]|nr:UDP-N-acetylmuramate dehydrogenase [Bacilli bacterium]
MDKIISKLDSSYKILDNESLSKYTTYNVGGIAKYIIYPSSIDKLVELVKILRNNNIKFKVIGNGSNLIFSSKTYDGVIIKLNYLNKVIYEDNILTVEAGYPVIKLAIETANKGLSGLEFASGIPGVISGLTYMNAGAYNKDMASIVEEVIVLDENNNIVKLSNKDMNFSYRYSILKDKNYIVLTVKIKLEYGNKEEILALIEDRKKRRMESQPLNYPSAGSVFRNPEGLSSWKLIDDLNLKGYSIGGAKVSEKHANFIINSDNASPEDIRNLIFYIKEKVKEKYDIDLIIEQEFVNWE